MKCAFLTGITGQDGSYLAEFLLQKSYKVTGVIRRTSSFNALDRLKTIRNNPDLKLVFGDIYDGANMSRLIGEWVASNPDCVQYEIYNLAAQSHVQVSFEVPEYTVSTNIGGVYHILHAILLLPLQTQSKVRFYQASSSEMFGLVQETPQTEKTPFYPRSPYAVSKLACHWATINYRESYNLFACNGILFNHESPRRGENFVTRKITRQIAEIVYKEREYVELGNIYALRDWGHSKDYVRAMWMMLQHDTPDDYVVATGEQHSVKEFVEKAFTFAMGITIAWLQDENGHPVGVDFYNHERVLVKINPKYFRKAEVETLLGDSSKIRNVLQWKPTTTFDELVEEMMKFDLE